MLLFHFHAEDLLRIYSAACCTWLDNLHLLPTLTGSRLLTKMCFCK